MSTHDDARRSIAAWLEAEAVDRAPSRLIEASRDRVRATPQRSGWWPTRTTSNRTTFATLAVAAAAVVVVAVGVVGLAQLDGPTIGPAVPLPSSTLQATQQPSVAAPSSAVDDPAGDGVVENQWPQQTDEDVRLAQERADAGDPAYAWQLDQDEVATRFLRDVLGWDGSLKTDDPSNDLGGMWIRCGPAELNPLYPTADENAPGADRCAPTIDDFRYEAVRLTLRQPAPQPGAEPYGIWVVHEWATSEPFAQVDPRVAETEVTARLEEWLAARIAGQGAEGKVDTEDDRGDGRCNRGLAAMCRIDEVPLLYATTSGARYERYEIDRVAGPRWPRAEMEFTIRLFADDGATVVEQPIVWIAGRTSDGRHGDPRLLSLVTAMTEDGQPVTVPFTFLDGELTASAARPWVPSHQAFNFGLSLNGMYKEERISFVPDPYLSTVECMFGSAPANAAALAESIRSCPQFEATAPVGASVGGAEGLYIDVTLAPGASVWPDGDGNSTVVLSRVPYPLGWDGSWRAEIGPDTRVRLYLVDLPEGSPARIMAIAIGAPQARFESVVEAAAPVLDSIEFEAP